MTGNAAFTVTGTFNYGSSGTTTLTGSTPISVGKFNQTGGTLVDSGVTITVNGTGASTWTKSGTFTATGTVIFNGAAPQIGASNFGNLTINVGSGNTATLTGDQTVSGTLTINSGATLAGGTFIITANGAVANSGTHSGSGKISLTGGSASHTLSGSGSYGNIELNDSNAAALTGSPTINGELTFTVGKISTDTNTLIIATTGSISGAAAGKYVFGNLQRNFTTGSNQSFNFAIGDASNYTPAALASIDITTGGSLTANATNGVDHPNISTSGIDSSKDVNRYWSLTAGGGIVVASYETTFTFVAGDVDVGATTSNFVVRRYSSSWSATTTGTRAATSTQATGLSSFGEFAVGEQLIDHYAVTASTPQTAGSAFNVSVTAQDILNQTAVADSATVVTMTGAGSVQFDSDGNATFGDNTKTLSNGTLTISTKDTVAEAITITATSTGSKTGTSSSITINPAAASKLAFSTQPVDTTYGTTQAGVVVQIRDLFNNNVSQSGTTISVALNEAGTLGGTTSVASGASGSATFSTLTINRAGSKTLTASAAGLTPATSSSFAINAKALTVTAVTSSRAYNGTTTSSGTPTVSGGLAFSDTANFTQTFTTKTVGTSKTLTPAGTVTDGNNGGNYSYSFVNDTTGVITAATVTVSGITANNKTYDGNTTATLSVGSAALVGVISGDTVTLSTGSAAGAFADKTVGTGKGVTVSGLTISGTDSGNYSLTQPTTTANITTATLTVSGITASNKVYDRTTTATLTVGSAALVGVVSGDTVSLSTSSAAGAFADKTVGTGKAVTVSGLTISGADSGNYSLTQPTTTATITAATLTVSGISASNKVYDRTTTGTLSVGSAALVGVVSGDTVSLSTSSAAGAFADKTVGTGKAVTVSGLTISGADAGNYALTQPTGLTANITAATLTVSGITASNKTYDGNTTATLSVGSAALVGVISGDTVTLSTSSAAGTFADKTVGTGKGVTVSGLTISGTDSGNYSLTQPTTTANITALPVVLAGTRVYDGTTDATASILTISNKVGSDDLSPSGTGTLASKNVGSQALTLTSGALTGLTLSGTASGNYTVTGGSGSVTITARAITVAAVSNTKTYDGTTTSSGTPTLTAGTLASGDTANFTQSFNNKNVGTGKTLTPSGTVNDGNSGNNHAVTFVNVTSGTVTVKGLTVSGITASNKAYDGTTTATLNTGSAALVGVVSGDLVTLGVASATGVFADQNVGTVKIVTISGLTISGADSTNYTLTQPTTTANITQATATVTLGSLIQTYNGSSKSATATTAPSGLTVNFTYNGSAIAPTASGTYTVVATISDTNYEGAATGTFYIVPSIISVAGPANASYRAEQALNFTVTYSSAVTVNTTGGTPRIALTIGSDVRHAGYVSGNGTSALVFRYTVQAGETDADGITSASPIDLNGGTIQDGAGNNAALIFTAPGTTQVLVDTTVPTISVGAPSATMTRGGPVTFTVTYSDVNFQASTLTAGNITLNRNGTTANGAINVTGSGTSYEVSVSTITGDGTLGITIASGTATDRAGNGSPAATSATFAVDNTAPSVSISAPSATLTRTASVTYTVTYTDTGGSGVSAITLATGGITLNATGTASGTVAVTGSGTSTRTVTISGIAGNGNLGISIASGTATDVAGNAAAAAGPSASVTVDNTAPSIAISAPSATLTRTASVTYTVTYADASGSGVSAITLTTGNITLNTTGTANGTVAVSGSDVATRTVTISGITGDGTLGISIAAATATDVAGNAVGSAGPSTVLSVDNTAPTLSISAPSVTFTKTASVTYTVSYADTGGSGMNAVSLATPNITLITTGTAVGTMAVTGTGTSARTVTISGIAGDGTLGISIASGTGTDLAGNGAPAAGPSATFTVDNTAPTLAISAPSSTIAANGPVSYTVTYSDPNFSSSTLTAARVTLNTTGTANGTVSVAGTGNTRAVTISSITGNGTLGISIAAETASDQAGNTAAASSPSTTFSVDNIAPTVTTSAASASFASNGPVTYTVTYADVNFSASTLTSAHVTLNRNGTANGTVNVTGSGTTRTVTISSITGNGTLGISIAAATGTDLAGNSAPASAASATFTVDNTAPTVTIGTPSRSFTATSSVTYTVTYADANFNTSALTAGNVSLNTTGTANGTVGVTGSATTYTVTISSIVGNGTLGISLAAGGATDQAGNTSPASSASTPFTVDNIAPTVTISAPTSTITATGPVVYTITYADGNFSASTLTAANVTLNSTGGSAGTISVSGSGSTRLVTISSITGNGTLGISLVAGTAADLAGNLAAGAGPSATFTVDQTIPSATIGAPSTTLTTHGPVTYSVTFSDPLDAGFVLGAFTAGQITLNATGTAGGTVAVSGSGNTRTVTVSSITGDGTLGISVAAGVVVNSAGHPSAAGGPSATFAVDNALPTVTLGAPSRSFASTGPVTYQVTYTDANFNASTLTSANVTLNTTGTATGTVGVTGSGNTRTVTISSITGNGTLGISIAAASATDLAGNLAAASAASATFTADNTAPTVAIGSPSRTFTTSGPVSYAVTYSDANFDTSDLTSANITLNATGTALGTVSVTGSGTSYTVTISSVMGAGTLGISIAAARATDLAGNTALASTASATFTTDNTAPTVTIGAPSVTITANGPATFAVTYADANFSASTLTAAQISLNRTGTAQGTVELSGSGTSYQVTVLGITGDGALSISIAAGTATDQAGNSSAAATGATFIVDHTAPAVQISAPSGTFAAGGPVSYTVTYSDDNFNPSILSPAHITLRTTGTANGEVTVTGTGVNRTVTISNTTGNGTLGILIGAGSATDLAGNPAAVAGPSATFTVDNTAPTVTISGPSATFARTGPVTYTVTYADANFNTSTLAASNVTLNLTATATGTVSVTGSGNTRTVTISNITGTGTIGISIAAGTATDLAGNAAAASSASTTFTGDNTAPTVTIGAPSSSFARGGPVTYAVTYADANFSTSTLTAADVSVNRTGGANGTVSVTGSGTSYTVTISSITGEGTLGFSIAANTATDQSGNSAPASGASSTFVVDNLAPTIALGSPSITITKGGPVTYTVTYADANFSASTLTSASVTLNRNGTANGTVSVAGSGTSYTVTISSITGDGALGVSIAAGTASDLSGNLAPGATSGTFTVDNTAPTLTIGAPSVNFATSGPVSFAIAYSDAHFNTSTLTAANVTLVPTGTAAGTVSVTGSGTSYTVTISNILGEGTLGISIAAGTATDQAGNAAASAASATFTVDNGAPTITISAPSSSFAKSGPVTYTVTYTDVSFSASTLTAANVTLHRTGTANGTVNVSGTGNTRAVTISNIAGDGTLGISLAANTASDSAGNLASAAGPSGGFIVDNTAPTVSISAPSSSFAKSGPITYSVSYADANFAASTLTAANLTLNRSGTANGTVSVTGSGTTYTVTISGVTGDGTLGISIVGGTATDQAGITASASGASATFTADNTAPTVTLGGPSSSFATIGPVTYTVTYADANFQGSTLAVANVTLNRTGTANGAVTVTGGGNSYTVTISSILGDGTLGISIPAGLATDQAGNLAPAATGGTLTVDNTAPTVTISAPSRTLTTSGPVTYTVTYVDANISTISLTAASIQLNRSGTANGTVSVSGSGGSRTVTISNTTGDGALGISLVAGTAIDLADNPAAAAGPSTTFTADNTPPVITSATTASVIYRSAFSYTIIASGSPVSFSASGLPTGLSVDTVTGVISGTPTQTGTFNIPLGATDTAGNNGTTTLALTVQPFDLTLSVNSATRTYGSANSTLTGTITGVQSGDAITVTYSTTATAASAVGSYPITPTLADPDGKLSNYRVTVNNGTLTVSAATLVVSAGNKSREYGSSNPVLTGTITGIQNNDNITATYSTTAALSSPVGSYAVVPTLVDPGNKLSNYSVTLNNGTLTVTQVGASNPLTVLVDNKARGYGAANPTLTGTITGILNNDNITASYTTAAGPQSSVGSHPIVATFNDPDNRLRNYTAITNNGTLTVSAAVLTVTAENQSRTYGVTNPSLTGTIAGLQNSDNITASYQTAAVAESPVGSYVITPTLNDPGSKVSNYSVVSNNGTLTVARAPLSVSAANASRTYGAANPSFTGGIAGLQNNDNITAIYNTTAALGSPVGSYPIVPTLADPGNKLSNYNVTLNNGALTVTQVGASNPLTVIADNKARVYGAANPTLTGTVTGVQNNDNITASYSTAAGPQSSVGSYSIIVSFNDPDNRLRNYTVIANNGTLTVSAATLNVTAGIQNRTYGAANPTLTGSITGIQNNDKITASYSTPATSSSGIGTYSIAPALIDPDNKLPNYTVTSNSGTLTVTAAALVVRADNTSREYGRSNPALTGTVTGIQNGDTIRVSYSTTATATSSPGSYSIKPQLIDPDHRSVNYAITLTDGALRVENRISLAGVAIDGYVAQATVFFDINKNQRLDAGEPSTRTDERGAFSLIVGNQFDTDGSGTLDPSEGTIVIQGGVDIATGLELRVPLLAPPGSSVVTPLTTLLAAALNQNPQATLEEVKTRVNSALGIASNVDLTRYDPFAAAHDGDPHATAVLNASSKVQDTLVQIASVLSGASGQNKEQVSQSTINATAQQIFENVSLDLSSASAVNSVLTRASQQSGVPLTDAIKDASVRIIAAGNALKDVIASAGGSSVTVAQEISRAQGVLQGSVSRTLELVGRQTVSASEAVVQLSSGSLDQLVRLAPLGDTTGEDIRPGTFSFSQSSYQATTSGSQAAVVTLDRSNGNKDAVTLNITLRAGDFVIATVPVTFGNREVQKKIDLWTVAGLDGLGTVQLSLALSQTTPPGPLLGSFKTAELAVLSRASIIEQPEFLAAERGSSATFSVRGGGSPRPDYQWMKNGVPIPGKNSSDLLLANVALSDAGAYKVLVSNSAGSETSREVTLTVLVPPTILIQPTNQMAYAGSKAQFVVVAEGNALSYQWYKNFVPIQGATDRILSLNNVTTSDRGSYTVFVSNSRRTVISAEATLTLETTVDPLIKSQPFDVTVVAGNSAQFIVEAAAAPPLRYQWTKDGQDIPGAEKAALAFLKVQSEDAGIYAVRISTGSGTTLRSREAILKVLGPPRIVLSPVGGAVTAGGTMRLSVAAIGTEPLKYQWSKNDQILTSTIGPTLVLENVQSSDQGGYRVVVINAYGIATSPAADVTVIAPLAISKQPASVSKARGSQVSFAVELTGTGPFTYEWRFNGQTIAGATLPSYSITNVQPQHAGAYAVKVSSLQNTVASDAALLTVLSQPIQGDFNGDGVADLLFEDDGGRLAIWYMDGVSLKSASFLAPMEVQDRKWRVVGTGRFNADAEEDILFQHEDGALAVWHMNGITLSLAEFLNPVHPGNVGWRVAGTGDFNKDGKTDLLFQHDDGTLAVWYMNGTKLDSAAFVQPQSPGDPNWRVVGVGDFNLDGNADLIFQHEDGSLALWYLDGIERASGVRFSPNSVQDTNWRVVGAADLNHDRKLDLVFQHRTDGTLAVWLMDGFQLTSAQLLTPAQPGGSWKVVAP